jgi:hypothetical protein
MTDTIKGAFIGAVATIAVGVVPIYFGYQNRQDAIHQAQIQRDEAEAKHGQVVSPAGAYDWEVATNRWFGYITINDKAPEIQMWKYQDCPSAPNKQLRLLKQPSFSTATASLLQNPSRLHVAIPVQFIKYDDKCNYSGLEEEETLEGELAQTIGFRGEIAYVRKDKEAQTGGMIHGKKSRRRSVKNSA